MTLLFWDWPNSSVTFGSPFPSWKGIHIRGASLFSRLPPLPEYPKFGGTGYKWWIRLRSHNVNVGWMPKIACYSWVIVYDHENYYGSWNCELWIELWIHNYDHQLNLNVNKREKRDPDLKITCLWKLRRNYRLSMKCFFKKLRNNIKIKNEYTKPLIVFCFACANLPQLQKI